eukprot:1283836-Alexandrium_andersonii.AAC.1
MLPSPWSRRSPVPARALRGAAAVSPSRMFSATAPPGSPRPSASTRALTMPAPRPLGSVLRLRGTGGQRLPLRSPAPCAAAA